MNNAKNVSRYLFSSGAISQLEKVIDNIAHIGNSYCVYFIDEYFKDHILVSCLPIKKFDHII